MPFKTSEDQNWSGAFESLSVWTGKAETGSAEDPWEPKLSGLRLGDNSPLAL